MPIQHGAEIMLFTGVRYERMADPAPVRDSGDQGAPVGGGVGGGRKRKRG